MQTFPKREERNWLAISKSCLLFLQGQGKFNMGSREKNWKPGITTVTPFKHKLSSSCNCKDYGVVLCGKLQTILPSSWQANSDLKTYTLQPTCWTLTGREAACRLISFWAELGVPHLPIRNLHWEFYKVTSCITLNWIPAFQSEKHMHL